MCMFKKILISLMVILVLGGIGYLGYVIFMAKSIQNVEFVGSMQTVYFVGDDLDFENSQLKVTYKNGDIKVLNLKDADVEVTLFSTSLEAHGKMKITYKSFTLTQEYDVLHTGLYYVSSKKVTNVSTPNNPETTDVTENNATEMYYFEKNGVLKYYHRTSATADWYMNDGNYDKNYSYSTAGDTVTVKLGKKTIELKASYNKDGFINLVSNEVEMNQANPDIPSKYTSQTFTHSTSIKDNLVIDKDKSTIDYMKSGETGNNYITFKVGEKISTHTHKIYLKIVYTNDTFFAGKTVYVEVCDEMNSRANPLQTIDTTASIPGDAYRETKIFYGTSPEDEKAFVMQYKVIAD